MEQCKKNIVLIIVLNIIIFVIFLISLLGYSCCQLVALGLRCLKTTPRQEFLLGIDPQKQK